MSTDGNSAQTSSSELVEECKRLMLELRESAAQLPVSQERESRINDQFQEAGGARMTPEQRAAFWQKVKPLKDQSDSIVQRHNEAVRDIDRLGGRAEDFLVRWVEDHREAENDLDQCIELRIRYASRQIQPDAFLVKIRLFLSTITALDEGVRAETLVDRPAGKEKDLDHVPQRKRGPDLETAREINISDRLRGFYHAPSIGEDVAAPNAGADQNQAGESAQMLRAQEAQMPKESHKRKKPVRRNEKYEGIDKALREFAAARPKSHPEVFRLLDDRKVAIPNRRPFKSAGGWLKGFQQDRHSASAWLSQAWGRLNLPAFPRGPKK